jgi:hypothetical protein
MVIVCFYPMKQGKWQCFFCVDARRFIGGFEFHVKSRRKNPRTEKKCLASFLAKKDWREVSQWRSCFDIYLIHPVEPFST